MLGPDPSRVADVRPGQPAHVPRPDPEGDAPALADRAGLRAVSAQGDRDRRAVPDEEAATRSWCSPPCCTATARCGASGPRCSTPTTSRARPSAGAPPTPTSHSATASAPASAGSSRCRRRRWCSGMVLQRFQLIDHTRYRLKLKETLTIKPDGFRIRVRRRTDRERARPAPRSAARALAAPAVEAPVAAVGPRHGTPLLVLYGSNLGTAEEARPARRGGRRGGRLRGDGGAARRVHRSPAHRRARWSSRPPRTTARPPTTRRGSASGCARRTPAPALAGVRYTVFGCGNRDWASTFQAVPRLIDERLAALGAERLYARGEGDAREDFDGQFQAWYEPLGGTLAKALGVELASADAAEAPRSHGRGGGRRRREPLRGRAGRSCDADRR